MTGGAFLSTFIVVFREALEAGLILGIILTLLARLGARRYFSHIIGSAAGALGLSFVLGIWLGTLADSTQERAKEILEGVVSLAAWMVLTYMFFWMERQARKIKSDIEAKVETALSTKDDLAMISLSFFAVLREGAETALFLKAVAIQSGASASWTGGLGGLLAAGAISAAVFVGGRKVPLRPLFRVTGFFILLMAAGLLGYGVHALEEAGWIPSVIEHVWNINPFLNEKEGVGSFLKALFGYNGNPSLTESAAYWGYWAVIAAILTRKREVQ